MNSNKVVELPAGQSTPRSLANSVSANISSVRALLGAIDDGLHLMMDKTAWGAYWPMMEYRGGQLRELLSIADGLLAEMDEGQNEVVRSFYGKAN